MIDSSEATLALQGIVEQSLAGGGEEVLMAATELGRRMVRGEMLPEEAVADWAQALVQGARRRAQPLDAQQVAAACAPLVELMMAYSLAFREQIAQRRDEEQRHLRAIAEQTADGVLVCDSAGRVQWLNAAMQALLAPLVLAPPCALPAGPWLPAAAAADTASDPAADGVTTALQRGTAWRGDVVDAAGRSFDAGVFPIRDRVGRPAGCALFLRDVSHVRELEQQCRQRERLDAVGTLAAGIAHDFNNLVGALLGFVDIGRASLQADPAGADSALAQIGIVGLRARGLVQQITAFASQQHEEPQAVDLRAVIEESLRFFEAYRPDGIALAAALPAAPAWIHGHAPALQRLLLNLLNNACHALTWRSGHITVTLTALAAPPRWRLAVADDGCGMSPEVRARVFDPFFTTREVGQGSGLGLSAAYGLVRALGGDIRVRSEPGAGAEFEVVLPQLESGHGT